MIGAPEPRAARTKGEYPETPVPLSGPLPDICIFDTTVEMPYEGSNGSEPQLTDREKEVVVLISTDFTTREIAGKLGIAIKTVDFHRATIRQKLRVKSIAGIVRYAIRMGLAQP